MSLDKLAGEIEAMAKAEAKAVTDEAATEAKQIAKEAEKTVSSYREEAIANATRMCDQIAVESIAAARQRNQKTLLVARRAELDATWEEVLSRAASPSMKGRNDVLKSLLAQASDEAPSGMILKPVKIDRDFLAKNSSGFEMGDEVDGLGGFVLEDANGSVLMDYRFEGRLSDAWDDRLGEVSSILFGE
tara:strand:+ start:365 stop:931 length:567 start_codon:yes stop_codon:yes gene_type:complete